MTQGQRGGRRKRKTNTMSPGSSLQSVWWLREVRRDTGWRGERKPKEKTKPNPTEAFRNMGGLKKGSGFSLKYNMNLLWHYRAVLHAVLSRVQLSATPWTVACQDPLSMEFSRQEYQSRVPFLTPKHLCNPATEPISWVSCMGRQILYH